MLKKIPLLLVILVLINSSFVSANCVSSMASLKGATIVALVYGATSAIGNFLWVFRWSKHTSASEETSAQIQEAGGIIAAIASAFLGIVVPSLIYVYQKNHPNKLLTRTQVLCDGVETFR